MFLNNAALQCSQAVSPNVQNQVQIDTCIFFDIYLHLSYSVPILVSTSMQCDEQPVLTKSAALPCSTQNSISFVNTDCISPQLPAGSVVIYPTGCTAVSLDTLDIPLSNSFTTATLVLQISQCSSVWTYKNLCSWCSASLLTFYTHSDALGLCLGLHPPKIPPTIQPAPHRCCRLLSPENQCTWPPSYHTMGHWLACKAWVWSTALDVCTWSYRAWWVTLV